MRARKFRYLLGDSSQETRRLKNQAALWNPVSFALFDRLKIKKHSRILEIGPGPGTLHMELRRRSRAPVDAVEISEAYANNLAHVTSRDAIGSGKIWNQDLAKVKLPARTYDLIFVRWVFLFLPNPETRLRQLAKALRPGGKLAIQDYYRETFGMVPRPPEWNDFFQADLAFFASQGGDASIAARLPPILKGAGLRVLDTQAHTLAGPPGSPVWNWLSDYFLGILERYAEFKPFSKAKAKRLRNAWLKNAREPGSLLIGPTVIDIISLR